MAEEIRPLRGAHIAETRSNHDQVDNEGADGHDQGHHGALANPNDVQYGEHHDSGAGQQHNILVDRRKDAADVLKARDRGDRRGEKIVHGDEHSSQAAPHRSKGLGRDRDHSASLGITPGDLDVFEGEENETARGEKHEERSGVLDVAVKDARDVIDRRADVAEDDRPGQKPVQLSGIPGRSHGVIVAMIRADREGSQADLSRSCNR